MSDVQSLIVRFATLGADEMERALSSVANKGAAAENATSRYEKALSRVEAQIRATNLSLTAQVEVYSNPAFDAIIERNKTLAETLSRLQAPTRTMALEMEAYTLSVESNILALKAQAAVLSTPGGQKQLSELQGLQFGVSQLSGSPVSLGPDLEKLNKETMPGLLTGMSKWHQLMLAVGAAYIGIRMTESLVEATALYEQMNLRLLALDGSAVVTAGHMVQLQEAARAPGLALEQATKGYLALRGLNETGEQSIAILNGIAKANTAMGGDQETFGRAITQIEHIIGLGKLSGQTINALSKDIPNFRGLMLEAFGTVDTKVINTKYTMDEFLAGIMAAANKLNTPTATITNDLDNIADGWMRLKASMLDQDFLKGATGLIDAFLQKINDANEKHKAFLEVNTAAQPGYYAREDTRKGAYDADAMRRATEAVLGDNLMARAEAEAADNLRVQRAKADQAQAKADEEAAALALAEKKRQEAAARAFEKAAEHERLVIWQEAQRKYNAEVERAYIAQGKAEAALEEHNQTELQRVIAETQKEVDPREAIQARYKKRVETADKALGPDAWLSADSTAIYAQIGAARDKELLDLDKKQADARARLLAGLKTEEQLIEASYAKRHADIMASTEITETEKLALLKKASEQEIQEQTALTEKRVGLITNAESQLSGAIADSFKQGASAQSAAYKAMFSVSKGFLIADASLKIFDAAAEAMRLPWPANIPAVAAVSAEGAVIINNMNSIVGAFDGGGMIPSGKRGIVGEYGPEIVEGPAFVTSRKQTAAAMNGSSGSVVNVHNYAGAAVETQTSPDGKTLDIIVKSVIDRADKHLAASVSRGDGHLNKAIQSTYGLQRGR